MIEYILNAASAVSAALAAYFWWKVAVEKTLTSKGLTADITNFDWLTKPLAAQADNNRAGAAFAGVAAALQVLVSVLKVAG